jgi:hypothetical protein
MSNGISRQEITRDMFLTKGNYTDFSKSLIKFLRILIVDDREKLFIAEPHKYYVDKQSDVYQDFINFVKINTPNKYCFGNTNNIIMVAYNSDGSFYGTSIAPFLNSNNNDNINDTMYVN